MGTLSLYLLTFNCARTAIQPNAFASHLFDALPYPQSPPDIPRAADGDLLAPGINLRLRDAKNTSNFAAEMIYSLFIS